MLSFFTAHCFTVHCFTARRFTAPRLTVQRRSFPRTLALAALLALGWFLLPARGVSQSAAADLAPPEGLASLVIAGGCFWCVEADFDKIPGVITTVSGYSGGTLENPSYEDVTRGGTGHYEAVRLDYDPTQVSFEALLTAFWHSTDPTDAGGQFCDRGLPYRTAIFVNTAQERAAAEASRQALRAQGFDIVTPILDRAAFYPAEEYHQDYARRNPIKYAFYRFSCGRNSSVRRLWGELAYKGISD